MEVRAHHIAATIVAVHVSKHHTLRGVLYLSEHTEKGHHVIFDPVKSKASTADRVSSEDDPEVMLERAIIDLAGFEAEEIYHIVNHLPDHGRRVREHHAVMEDASRGIGDMDVKRSDLVRMTLELVSRNWFAVRDLARLLLLSESGSLDSIAAMQRLDRMYRFQANPVS